MHHGFSFTYYLETYFETRKEDPMEVRMPRITLDNGMNGVGGVPA